jgi:chromate transporter
MFFSVKLRGRSVNDRAPSALYAASSELKVEGPVQAIEQERGSAREVFGVFLRLGLTSFGGPIAHLGYFERDIVRKRGWIDHETYGDIVALCQMLPGPASSQVGMAIGLRRAGVRGALAAWLGFTAPSAILMILFAYLVDRTGDIADSGWIHGLKIVAVAIVAQAVWSMAKNLTPDRPRLTIAFAAAISLLLWSTVAGQIAVIVAGGAIGWWLFRGNSDSSSNSIAWPRIGKPSLAILGVFAALLGILPLLRAAFNGWGFAFADVFYRSGALVFGGGHVVLPLLQSAIVEPGWMSNDEFIAGYGAAQAVPGPLFTFAGYLGAAMHGIPGAAIALVAIFLPSFLLVVGVMPFWDGLRVIPGMQAVLRGINAAVVGILLAALYDPIWTSAIFKPEDAALALVAFGLLVVWKVPPIGVVVVSALGGAFIDR